MSYMFYNNTALKDMDLENFDTSKATNMSSVFQNDAALTTLNIDFDLSSAMSTSNMFNGCASLTEVRFTDSDAPNLTNMSYMFKQCKNLEEISMPGLIGANVTNINAMLQECESLKVLNLENFLGSGVTDGTSLFEKCKSLETIRLGLNSRLITMANMFNDCSELVELSIPNLDTTVTTNMSYAFANNPKLETLTLGENFSTANATNLSYMFYNSPKLSLPLNKIDSSKAINIAGMFQNCPLTQDELDIIKAWDTSKVTTMDNLFNGCKLPEEVDLSNMN